MGNLLQETSFISKGIRDVFLCLNEKMVDILSFRGYSVASKYFENQNIWKSKYLVFKTTCDDMNMIGKEENYDV